MSVLRGMPRELADPGRCLVMGILNVTPDSFSDGGSYLDAGAAVEHGLRLLRDGADIVDVGGESTRPGAERVPADEERRRVLPVISALARAGAVISVDTMRATTAQAALDVGASIVNDVSGGRADKAMAGTVASAEVPYVVMHWRGHSSTMQQRATYDDVVADVARELGTRLAELVAAGVDPERVILDPGIGFAKQPHHNWVLLGHLEVLSRLGRPLLVGASRKRFLDEVLAPDRAAAGTPAARDYATAATTALAAAHGAWCVRVHDVVASRDAVRVAAAVAQPALARARP